MAANPVQPGKDKAVSNSVDTFESQRIESFGNDTSTPNLQRMRSVEQTAMLATGSPAPLAVKPKKGGFQITRVVTKMGDHLTDDHDCDSLDDLDETNTEDVSSDIIDLPKPVDIEQDPSSSDTIQSLVPDDLGRDTSAPKPAKPVTDPAHATQGFVPNTASQNLPQKPVVCSSSSTTAGQSIPQVSGQTLTHSDSNKLDKPIETHSTRFKVVKIESKEPFRRGRWTCLDFLDPPQKALPAEGEKSGERVQDDERGSGNSSAASSVHYIPGVDDPSKNPFGSSITSSEGHTIVEPQPVRPLATGGQLTNGGDFTNTDQTASASNPNTGVSQGVVLPTSSVSTTLAVSKSVISSDMASRGIQSVGGSQPPAVANALDFTAKLQSHNIPSTNVHSMEYMKSMGLAPNSDFALPVPTTLTNTSSSSIDKTHSSKNISNNGSGLQLGSEFLGDSGVRLKMSESSALKSLSQNSLTPPLLEMVSARVREEDESGASTVAIDNKIEQAMDLVKSHLMFAVREEVELLKEQISELLEKNSLLEYENAILRANASPETLAQINTPPDSQTTAQSKQAAVSSSS